MNYSLEFFPPKDQESLKDFIDQARLLSIFSPEYMSITHTSDTVDNNQTMEAVKILKKNLSIEIKPHMTCINYSKSEIMEMTQDYLSLGVDSIVALRGNTKQSVSNREPYYDNSLDFIKALNAGFDIRVSISGYPEAHPESRGVIADFIYLKEKSDAGGDEIITQWCFSNDLILRYRDLCYARDIKIPISPGILPISDIKKVKYFAKLCGSTIPVEIEKAFLNIEGNDDAAEDLGVQFAIQQIDDLLNEGIDNFHLYTLNRGDMTRKIIEHFEAPNRIKTVSSEMKAS